MELSTIATEKRNENTLHIDELETLEMIRLINTEDKKVAYAVEKEVDNIAAAVDVIAEKLRNGGRLIYAGCGTSGRLGVLDAANLLHVPGDGDGNPGGRISGNVPGSGRRRG